MGSKTSKIKLPYTQDTWFVSIEFVISPKVSRYFWHRCYSWRDAHLRFRELVDGWRVDNTQKKAIWPYAVRIHNDKPDLTRVVAIWYAGTDTVEYIDKELIG